MALYTCAQQIMKSDEDVRMISAEAPVLFAKVCTRLRSQPYQHCHQACEMFILELTLRAWHNSEECKRRTLQRNDIAAAITKTDIFDFLVDIVPRDERVEAMEGARGAPMPAAGAWMCRVCNAYHLFVYAYHVLHDDDAHGWQKPLYTAMHTGPAGMYFAQPGMMPSAPDALMRPPMAGLDPSQMMFPYSAMMPPPGWPPMPGASQTRATCMHHPNNRDAGHGDDATHRRGAGCGGR